MMDYFLDLEVNDKVPDPEENAKIPFDEDKWLKIVKYFRTDHLFDKLKKKYEGQEGSKEEEKPAKEEIEEPEKDEKEEEVTSETEGIILENHKKMVQGQNEEKAPENVAVENAPKLENESGRRALKAQSFTKGEWATWRGSRDVPIDPSLVRRVSATQAELGTLHKLEIDLKQHKLTINGKLTIEIIQNDITKYSSAPA